LSRYLCINLGIDCFIMWTAVQKWGFPSMSIWSCLDGFTTCYTIFKQCQNAIYTGYSQSNIWCYRNARQYGYGITYIRCNTYTAKTTPQVGFSFPCLI
jgi:hypothetical protein